jgi:hypothetical protein
VNQVEVIRSPKLILLRRMVKDHKEFIDRQVGCLIIGESAVILRVGDIISDKIYVADVMVGYWMDDLRVRYGKVRIMSPDEECDHI